MKILISRFALIVAVVVMLTGCQSNTSKRVENLAPDAHQIIAEEIIQTSSYTYLFVSEEDQEYWIAIEKADIQKGGTYFYSDALEMIDFTSDELGRTFDRILFIQDFTDQPITQTKQMPIQKMTGRQPIAEKSDIEVAPAEGGITIAELFANKESYSGKRVKISGEVVKFSPQIMDRNWIHLQDGTKDEDHYDLTVTTQVYVNAGDIVTFEGVVALDKDFGAGYFYDVIMEEAEIK